MPKWLREDHAVRTADGRRQGWLLATADDVVRLVILQIQWLGAIRKTMAQRRSTLSLLILATGQLDPTIAFESLSTGFL